MRARSTWRLKGICSRVVLIHRRDLRAGEEAIRFQGPIVPDVFDPGDFLSVRAALELCETLNPDSQFAPRSARQQRSYLESCLLRALQSGELVMIPEEANIDNITIAAPKPRGAGTAWRLDSGNRM